MREQGEILTQSMHDKSARFQYVLFNLKNKLKLKYKQEERVFVMVHEKSWDSLGHETCFDDAMRESLSSSLIFFSSDFHARASH